MGQPDDAPHVIEMEGPHSRELLTSSNARAARARYNELLILRRDVRITLRHQGSILASACAVRPRTGSQTT
jgi:hypothetical protein